MLYRTQPEGCHGAAVHQEGAYLQRAPLETSSVDGRMDLKAQLCLWDEAGIAEGVEAERQKKRLCIVSPADFFPITSGCVREYSSLIPHISDVVSLHLRLPVLRI